MFGIIYKITNLIDSKFYIGQTINSAELRFRSHYNSKKGSNSYFHNALRKYGKENFLVEAIYEAQTKEELNLKEIELIALYKNECPELLYNIANGGCGEGTSENLNCKPCINVTTSEEFESATKMSESYGQSYQFILACLKGKQIRRDGYILRYKDQELMQEANNNYALLPKPLSLPKKVVCLDTGELFNSIKEASEKLGILKSCISNVLNNRAKTAGKLRFSCVENGE